MLQTAQLLGLLLTTRRTSLGKLTVGFIEVICSFKQLWSILMKKRNANNANADVINDEFLLLCDRWAIGSEYICR